MRIGHERDGRSVQAPYGASLCGVRVAPFSGGALHSLRSSGRDPLRRDRPRARARGHALRRALHRGGLSTLAARVLGSVQSRGPRRLARELARRRTARALHLGGGLRPVARGHHRRVVHRRARAGGQLPARLPGCDARPHRALQPGSEPADRRGRDVALRMAGARCRGHGDLDLRGFRGGPPAPARRVARRRRRRAPRRVPPLRSLRLGGALVLRLVRAPVGVRSPNATR